MMAMQSYDGQFYWLHTDGQTYLNSHKFVQNDPANFVDPHTPYLPEQDAVQLQWATPADQC